MLKILKKKKKNPVHIIIEVSNILQVLATNKTILYCAVKWHFFNFCSTIDFSLIYVYVYFLNDCISRITFNR